jgi:anti-sigma factor RsiW
MARPLTCRELVDFLADYLAGELPPEQGAEFDAHLARCPDCVTYLNTYRASVELARGTLEPSPEPVPESVPEDLVRAILAARLHEAR